MVRLAFYLTGSWPVAEELAQEAFVRLWRRWSGQRDRHAALGYLRTTVVNLSRSSLRRRLLELRHQRSIREEGHDVDPVVGLDVARALAALPARKRACVVLRHLVDLSVEETPHRQARHRHAPAARHPGRGRARRWRRLPPAARLPAAAADAQRR